MNEIELEWEAENRGAFVINEGLNRLAEMSVAIKGENIIVFHTQVSDELKGKGIATKLLQNLENYARENSLKVVPRCSYVRVQFERHPDKYDDIWNKDWQETT